jgi:hypothetical protein
MNLTGMERDSLVINTLVSLVGFQATSIPPSFSDVTINHELTDGHLISPVLRNSPASEETVKGLSVIIQLFRSNLTRLYPGADISDPTRDSTVGCISNLISDNPIQNVGGSLPRNITCRNNLFNSFGINNSIAILYPLSSILYPLSSILYNSLAEVICPISS